MFYYYYNSRRTPVSRDMLIARRSMLQSERDVLNATIKFSSVGQDKAKAAVDALSKKVNYTTERRDNATKELIKAQRDCAQQKAQEDVPSTPKGKRTTSEPPNNPCNDFKQATEGAVDATFQQAQASMEYFSSSFLLNSNNQYQSFLQSRISSIDNEISEINAQLEDLKESQVYLGEMADSKEFKALNELGNETVQDFDSEWMQFEYDSDSTHIHTDQDKSSLNVAAGFSVGVPAGASLSASGYYGKGTADLMQAVNSASLKASGELLRVTIKRPWFRPSLFENPVLYFVSYIPDFSINMHGTTIPQE